MRESLAKEIKEMLIAETLYRQCDTVFRVISNCLHQGKKPKRNYFDHPDFKDLIAIYRRKTDYDTWTGLRNWAWRYKTDFLIAALSRAGALGSIIVKSAEEARTVLDSLNTVVMKRKFLYGLADKGVGWWVENEASQLLDAVSLPDKGSYHSDHVRHLIWTTVPRSKAEAIKATGVMLRLFDVNHLIRSDAKSHLMTVQYLADWLSSRGAFDEDFLDVYVDVLERAGHAEACFMKPWGNKSHLKMRQDRLIRRTFNNRFLTVRTKKILKLML